MRRFKLIELEIEEIEYYNIYYLGDYIPEINLRCYKEFYYQDKQKIDYFLKNKDKYLFVKKNDCNIIVIIDKGFILSNINKLNYEFGKEYCRFVKYQLIKERLYRF